MKLSVSLPDEDVRFLDRYAKKGGVATRSGAVHRAIRLLKASELGSAYETAWSEWEEVGDSKLWESTSPDGLSRR